MTGKGKIQDVLKVASDFVLKAGRTLRAKEIIEAVHRELPSHNLNTIGINVSYLHERFPNKIERPARGLFRAKDLAATAGPTSASSKARDEREFYDPLKDWLLAEGICTTAVVLGGNKWGGKWGTPDVVGVAAPRKTDLIKRSEEVVSAEIKTEPSQLVTAFGQACSYGLFSHRTYVVVPEATDAEELNRLKLLCTRFGVGMVVFNHADATNPSFDEWVAARLLEPEYEQLNDRLSKLADTELFR